jgi:2-oxoisovalerate dehydrogenase E2 component (dihydrolipoyl transacylase)
MGRYLFRLPDIGEGVAQAEITAWYVKPGDRVEEDQTLVDVMTDKATVDMTSPVAGLVVAVHGELGQLVAVGSTLIEFDIAGENEAVEPRAPASEPVRQQAEPPPASPPPLSPSPPEPEATPARASPAQRRSDAPIGAAASAPIAAPATRRRAFDLGVPLQFVAGTGPGGRITPDDLDAYLATKRAPSPSAVSARRDGVNAIKIIGLRRRIAERMQDAKRRIPHFSYIEEFDMTEIEGLRRELNEGRREGHPKLTLLPFFMRAVAKLQPEFPHVNARYDDDAGVLLAHDGVHIGIATQTPGGLMVPVVRHVEALDVWDCARELIRVTTAARDGSAAREDLTGSTITLTSLGALGGVAATPVINSPEVAIVGPNKLVERPVVRDGQIVVRTLMNLSSSFDHRIVDGHDAARFVQRLKRMIEQPAHLFMD